MISYYEKLFSNRRVPQELISHRLHRSHSFPPSISTGGSSVPSRSRSPRCSRSPHPSLQLFWIADPQPHLERFGLRREACLDAVALQRVEDGSIGRVLGRNDAERRNQPEERRVELAVGEVGAHAHAGAGAVAVVRRAAALEWRWVRGG